MKYLIIFLIILISGVAVIFAAHNTDSVMRRQSDGTYIVNTSTLCASKGFRGVTPVEVYIRDGVVVKIVTIKNNESPNYFEKVKKYLLPLFSNVKIKKAKKISQGEKPDGCTGATYSTRAVQANITAALEYYEVHK